MGAVTLSVSNVSVNFEPLCYEDQVSGSTSREVAWVCALQWPSILHKHSGSQPWDVSTLIPALSSWQWKLAVLGGWRSEADTFPFLPCCDPRFEWQLSEMDYAQWYGHVWEGRIPVLQSVRENGLLCFRWISNTRDEQSKRGVGGCSALYLDHTASEMTKRSVKVEHGSCEV